MKSSSGIWIAGDGTQSMKPFYSCLLDWGPFDQWRALHRGAIVLQEFYVGGDGVWPAFWMLPAKLGNGSLAYGPWPLSGEIDIMEAVNDMSVVMGTAHFGNPKGQLGGQLAADVASGPFAGTYHVYAVDWSWESVIW